MPRSGSHFRVQRDHRWSPIKADVINHIGTFTYAQDFHHAGLTSDLAVSSTLYADIADFSFSYIPRIYTAIRTEVFIPYTNSVGGSLYIKLTVNTVDNKEVRVISNATGVRRITSLNAFQNMDPYTQYDFKIRVKADPGTFTLTGGNVSEVYYRIDPAERVVGNTIST